MATTLHQQNNTSVCGVLLRKPARKKTQTQVKTTQITGNILNSLHPNYIMLSRPQAAIGAKRKVQDQTPFKSIIYLQL